MKFDNSVAVITGGASGLGYAAARELSGRGARVVIVDRDVEAGHAAAAALGDNVLFKQADVTDPEAMADVFAFAGELGTPRVAVACAGIGIAERTIDRERNPHKLDSFKRVIDVNVVGTFNLLRFAAQAIASADPVETERGVIIATASIAAYDGQIGQLAYSASKGAIVAMTLPAARDLSTVGVRVMAIAPGIMDTPLLGLLPAEVKANLGRSVPFPKRLGLPDDFGSLVGAICDNPYLNGEVIRLDGALRMPPK